MEWGQILIGFVQVILGGVVASIITLKGQKYISTLTMREKYLEKFHDIRLEQYMSLWKTLVEYLYTLRINAPPKNVVVARANALNACMQSLIFISQDGATSATEVFGQLTEAEESSGDARLKKVDIAGRNMHRIVKALKADTGLSFSEPSDLKSLLGVK